MTHRGRHFSLTDATLHLKPVQRPHPPIWIGASSDPAVRRVGRFGFPWLINPHVSLSGMTQQMTLLRAAAAEAGKKIPDTVPVFKEFAVAGSRGEALRMAQPYLEPKYQSYAQLGLDKPMPETKQLSVPFDQLAQDRFIIGDPAECAAELRRYHDAVGANHFLLRLQWPGMPQRYALEQIRLVGTDVMPLMRQD